MIKCVNNWRLKDLHVVKDPQWDSYYLSAVYHVDEDDGVYEIHVPKILLPVSFGAPSYTVRMSDYWLEQEKTIDLGFGELDVIGNITKKLIKPKIKEMTMDEIEKALGHKVKIVSEGKR